MTSGFSDEIFLADPDATTRLGRSIAPALRAGDVLLLQGGIGAGKTHFARALIQARLAVADRMEDVPSPTYTLVQVYDDAICEIWHADLYRLTHPEEAVELGLDLAFDSAITLIEWPDRLGGYLPRGALKIEFDMVDRGRNVSFRSKDPSWASRLDFAAKTYA